MTEKATIPPAGPSIIGSAVPWKKHIPSCFCQVLQRIIACLSGSWRILLRAAPCWCGMRRDMAVPGRSGWILP